MSFIKMEIIDEKLFKFILYSLSFVWLQIKEFSLYNYWL